MSGPGGTVSGMAGVRVVVDGVGMGESPRWHGGRLWFADWLAGRVVSVADDGETRSELEVGAMPLCFDWLPDGRLLCATGRQASVLVREHDGTVTGYADLSALDPHSWNEIAVAPGGDAYVNGIGFDFPSGEVRPGQVAVVRPDGEARPVAGDLQFPNGMLVVEGGRTLVVAESYAARITSFSIGSDGSLSGRRVWADLGDASPDGICVDAEGALWYADVPHRRCVRVREGGEVLATVELDRGAFSCALGGPAGRTLYVTTARWPDAFAPGAPPSGQVVAVEVEVPAPGPD